MSDEMTPIMAEHLADALLLLDELTFDEGMAAAGLESPHETDTTTYRAVDELVQGVFGQVIDKPGPSIFANGIAIGMALGSLAARGALAQDGADAQ